MPEPHWYDPFRVALRSGAFVFAHFCVAAAFIATNYGLEHFLRSVGDPALFDRLPWRFVFDAVDLGLVGIFGIMGLLEAIRVFRNREE